ncbi:MAG: hypothetical protein IJ144_05645 [Prevotella sp.]|nr:hypothetical protein [Prevotella sp.]
MNSSICNLDLLNRGIYWIPCACVLISLAIVIWRLVCMKWYCFPENRRIKHLWLYASIMLFVWSVGFGLYMYAIDQNSTLCRRCDCTELSWLELCFRSAVASLGMFAFDIDSNIFDNISRLPHIKGAISVCSFVAGFLTIGIVLELFGARLWASVKAWWSSIVTSKKELCVFFGINEATMLLAGSINNRTAKLLADSIDNKAKDREFRLVFVEFPIVDDEDFSTGLGSIMKSVTHRSDTFRVTRKYNAHLSIANARPNSIAVAAQTKAERILQRIGLKDVARMIRHTDNKVHLFFLSDDEAFNIESVAVLKHDATIQGKSDKHECVFYCHTRNNSIHRVVENEMQKSKLTVKVVDGSRLCVDILKCNEELQPVNFVDIQDDATVSSPFNALVVGFGEVGLDAVRFLYEFGAFVKTGSTAQKVERSEFHCDVVDKNMADLAGTFIANAPAIKPQMSFTEDGMKGDSLITLHQMDCRSVDFYQHLEKWIPQMNYVVIATNDDELNISLAVRMLRLAIRHNTNFEHFRILVRIKHDENGHFKHIAHYYNRLWMADMKKDETDKWKRQNIVRSVEEIESPIRPFGSYEEIFKYEYVINDDLLDKAKKFKDRYDASIKALQIQSKDKVDPTMTWDEEIERYMQLEEAYNGYSPTYSNVMKLRRMQSQNFENCYHVYTKQRLAKCALGADEYKALTSHQLFRKNNETVYKWKTGVRPKGKLTNVLDTLARTEHLRWNASHEILGYQGKGYEKDKDEARLCHGCLKEWENLTESTKSYDYNIVDVSLDMIEIKQEGQNSNN